MTQQFLCEDGLPALSSEMNPSHFFLQRHNFGNFLVGLFLKLASFFYSQPEQPNKEITWLQAS